MFVSFMHEILRRRLYSDEHFSLPPEHSSSTDQTQGRGFAHSMMVNTRLRQEHEALILRGAGNTCVGARR